MSEVKVTKIIIAGGREFNDYELMTSTMQSVLDGLYIMEPEHVQFVSGDARGADRLGAHLGKEANISVHTMPAKWDEHGKSAGYIRNKEMAEYADVLVAFWDGVSKGTKHMIDLARSMELKVYVIKY